MLQVIVRTVYYILMVIQYAILARAIFSFFPFSRENPLIRILNLLTEPVLAPIRALIEKTGLTRNMTIDFSPLAAFLIIGLIINIFF